MTRSPRSGDEAGIESSLLDLSSVPLKTLRSLDGKVLSEALRHVVERVAHIPMTVSGSQGATRVE
ncbi:hypothetical protein [Amycolatopsis sp. WQ 127309]|uniref:hypothetical protein n=1 Tax=Amycolatopsis sp. WQ 127309 TaxID=2932773 RepID=UPI001FF64F11|nr:hypothetical protein [Amycolatopsis sp. WQ 127309]UOZ07546.1 hypothetical protein MUY22_04415 [Amycolatopsis sp. WQ 127309]